MSKTLQNHQLAYLGEEKKPSGSKNNIKLKWLFPIVSEIVVLFPRMSHFWTEYAIVLHCDEAYLLGIFVGHIIYQRIRSGEEFSLTLHFANESWIRDVKWFIQKGAKKRILKGLLTLLKQDFFNQSLKKKVVCFVTYWY